MAARKNIDWMAVEGDYRAGTMTVAALAEKWGCTESAVRHAAKKSGWLRDPAGVKAARVKAATSGSPPPRKSMGVPVAHDPVAVATAFATEVDRDIRVMNLAAGFFETVLEKVAKQIPTTDAPRDQKVLTETGTMAATMYRKIRNLEDKPGGRTIEDMLREL